MKRQQKSLALESSKTRKIRQKIEQHFTCLEEKVTTRALERKVEEIRNLLEKRSSNSRSNLRSKSFSVMETPAEAVDKRVEKVAEKFVDGT